MHLTHRFAVSLVVAATLLVGSTALVPGGACRAAADDDQSVGLEPLVDVHELMEHVVEGTFTAVKTGLGQEPADRKAWRQIRSMSIILGESATCSCSAGRKPRRPKSGTPWPLP